ncbi:MAG: hypothetical protein BGO55_27095 [Sphingobacteriales bacterium 50-39]|nr:hypothetical protein [Sphingobacteriales bacterium]OJW56716.1 MAG: hypothetical protein BGO55_27095 [Sphingobacteriales bacterium 50-39]
MRTTRFFPIIAALILLAVTSCRKETSVEGPGFLGGTFMATIDGSQWIAADTQKSATIVGGLINLTGISADKQQISITLNDTLPGTYKLTQQSTSIAVYGNIDSSNTLAFTTNQGKDSTQAGGTVTVINIDAIKQTITGTFSFTVFRDVDGKQKTITDGVFYQLPYTSSLPPSNSGDTMTADIDGQHWAAKSILSSSLSNVLVLNGSFLNGTQSVSLLMPQNIQVGGPYTLDYTTFTYYGFYSPQISGGFASNSGHLTILLNDAANKRIRGNFDFHAADPTGQSTETHQLTNGFFSVGYQ